MNEFELPSNIKQIGSIGGGSRIYVEDYVCTYLKQYAESGEHCEKTAFLIGKYIIIDSQPVIFINGAIQGKYTEFKNGTENFTQKSYMHAEQEIDKYFKGFEIVGWMQSQPGYSIFLNPNSIKYHMMHFRKPYQMIFVMDPVEKLSAFYSWNQQMTDLEEVKGYFVYYDKNPGMQEYMIDNKLISLEMQEKMVKIEKAESVKTVNLTGSKRKIVLDGDGQGNHVKKKQTMRREDMQESKRLVNMLVSFSAVLFVICFIMGVGLVQNDDRINQLEANLDTLNSAYTYIVGQVRQSSAQPVFAQQNGDNGQNENEILQETNTEPDLNATEEPDNQSADELDEPIAQTPQPEPTIEPTQEVELQPEPQSSEIVPASVINIDNQTGSNDNIPDTYVVQEGDNLLSISKEIYGTTDMVEAIMQANDLSDADKIFFGKILILPKKQ